MGNVHPLDVLQGYRLGNRQATTELQRPDTPGIHINFKVLDLIAAVEAKPGQAIILTGTAGDGKTYLAYKLLDALGVDRDQVLAAQAFGGYDHDGIFIDLDLSAGVLSVDRIARLQAALSTPRRLALICANEGKLAELEERLCSQSSAAISGNVLRVNLSRRALVHPDAWHNLLRGALDGPVWQTLFEDNTALTWNRAWLGQRDIADRLCRYLMLPYLLGEPITVREMLSFLAYALGGGLDSSKAAALQERDRIRYLLFNTVFGEPDGYEHGGRAAPTEKLLWWMFRFDPAAQASPEIDLRLLVDLASLNPPTELLTIWREDLVVQTREQNDVAYRRRLARFMRYARRWYALASDDGMAAYFPFRHFASFVTALSAPAGALEEQVMSLIRGLNLLLSGGQVGEDFQLKLFYLPADSSRNFGAIYSNGAGTEILQSDLHLESDLTLDQTDAAGDCYLERMPRRLYLCYAPQPSIRLPISLFLYEVLVSAASPEGGFPATLWARERDAVVRFMSVLNRVVRPRSPVTQYVVQIDDVHRLQFTHKKRPRQIDVST
jgi:hypothetical protein